MPLETITYIPDLVAANPTTSDGLVQGDDHLRGIKAALRNTLPNWTAAALAATQAELDATVSQSKGLAVHLVPAGTVSAPGLQVVGDSNTGVYFPTADEAAVTVGGQKAIHVHADKSVELTGAATIAGAPRGHRLDHRPRLSAVGGTAGVVGRRAPHRRRMGVGQRPSHRQRQHGLPGPACPVGHQVRRQRRDHHGRAGHARSRGGTARAPWAAPRRPGASRTTLLTTIGSFIGACLHLLTTGEMPRITIGHSH
jgi:hypothetical protein